MKKWLLPTLCQCLAFMVQEKNIFMASYSLLVKYFNYFMRSEWKFYACKVRHGFWGLCMSSES